MTDPSGVGIAGQINRFVEGIAASTGWRRRGWLALLGALAALALPPIHAVVFLPVAFSGLLVLMDRDARPRAGFAAGWWFGFGHFVVGTYWISNSMLTDPARFGWMIPFALGGLSAVLALFPALAACATSWLKPRGPSRLLVLAIAWTIAEWFRGWVLTGFPWNPIGHVWAFSDAMIQLPAYVGVWGLSFITIAAAAAPALLLDWGGARRPGETRTVRRKPAAALLLVAIVVLAAIWAGGARRLATADTAPVPGIHLRLVQPNIDPSQKGKDDLRLANLARQLALAIDTEGFDKVTHVVWPESAIKFLLDREADVRRAVAAAVPTDGLLLSGVTRAEPSAGAIERFWNSMAAIDGDGAIVATYDKSHLVPYGEYVPWRNLMPFVSKLTPGEIDFSAGPGPLTLRLPGLPPVGPLICYEVIFPGRVVDPSDRPDWILNLTNDGWFGRSTGPYQHLVSARLRAVEEGLPIVRAANTGISAVIDAYGRVGARTALNQSVVLDVDLPRPAPSLTWYARFGDWATMGLLMLAAIAAYLMRNWR